MYKIYCIYIYIFICAAYCMFEHLKPLTQQKSNITDLLKIWRIHPGNQCWI